MINLLLDALTQIDIIESDGYSLALVVDRRLVMTASVRLYTGDPYESDLPCEVMEDDGQLSVQSGTVADGQTLTILNRKTNNTLAVTFKWIGPATLITLQSDCKQYSVRVTDN